MKDFVITCQSEPDENGNYRVVRWKDLVRCKDCKHYESGYGCKLWHTTNNASDDWFCADGERRAEP